MINERQFDLAAQEFDRWDEAGGKVMAGLLRRRIAAERILILKTRRRAIPKKTPANR
jgi:GH24 family phage-related lysozyme (muramidase)